MSPSSRKTYVVGLNRQRRSLSSHSSSLVLPDDGDRLQPPKSRVFNETFN
jgi:hypothetical protein